ncbi:MAG: ribonuclease P protein component [Halioglobus sp.]
MGRVANHKFDASFGKAKRLLNAHDYTAVFENTEAKAFHNNLLLLGRKNGGSTHRLGLVIAKKNVRLAAQRNRIKRLAREFVRKVPDGTHIDVVLLSRRGIDQLDNAEITALLQKQWAKLATKFANAEQRSNQDSQCAEL